MVESIRKVRESGGCQISDEKRKMLSEKLRNAWASGEQAKKQKQTCIKKYGVDHHMKLPEFRNLTKARRSGKKLAKKLERRFLPTHKDKLTVFQNAKEGLERILSFISVHLGRQITQGI